MRSVLLICLPALTVNVLPPEARAVTAGLSPACSCDLFMWDSKQADTSGAIRRSCKDEKGICADRLE